MTDDNVIQFKKPTPSDKKTVEHVTQEAGPDRPQPQVYRFTLVDGTEREVEGFLAAGASQVIMGDEDGLLIYLVPLDQICEVVHVSNEYEETDSEG